MKSLIAYGEAFAESPPWYGRGLVFVEEVRTPARMCPSFQIVSSLAFLLKLWTMAVKSRRGKTGGTPAHARCG
jgi:hypothetical protein